MKTVIVFNHPYSKSYCNAILESVIAGLTRANNEVDLIHLDKDEFDPVMREKDLAAFAMAKYQSVNNYDKLDPQVLCYKERLEQADHLIFIFPIWWELMPAMTKGFIDKVIFPGVAYEYPDKGMRMKCRMKHLKSLTVITTMNTPSFLYRILFRNAVKHALMTGTFWKIGCPNRKWLSLNMVKFVSDLKRKKWLHSIENRFTRLK